MDQDTQTPQGDGSPMTQENPSGATNTPPLENVSLDQSPLQTEPANPVQQSYVSTETPSSDQSPPHPPTDVSQEVPPQTTSGGKGSPLFAVALVLLLVAVFLLGGYFVWTKIFPGPENSPVPTTTVGPTVLPTIVPTETPEASPSAFPEIEATDSVTGSPSAFPID